MPVSAARDRAGWTLLLLLLAACHPADTATDDQRQLNEAAASLDANAAAPANESPAP